MVLNEVDCETDWVELVNTGEEAADLTGWLLTDDAIDATPRAPPTGTRSRT